MICLTSPDLTQGGLGWAKNRGIMTSISRREITQAINCRCPFLPGTTGGGVLQFEMNGGRNPWRCGFGSFMAEFQESNNAPSREWLPRDVRSIIPVPANHSTAAPGVITQPNFALHSGRELNRVGAAGRVASRADFPWPRTLHPGPLPHTIVAQSGRVYSPGSCSSHQRLFNNVQHATVLILYPGMKVSRLILWQNWWPDRNKRQYLVGE